MEYVQTDYTEIPTLFMNISIFKSTKANKYLWLRFSYRQFTIKPRVFYLNGLIYNIRDTFCKQELNI